MKAALPRWLALATAAATLAVSSSALAAEAGKITVLFTGDNGGEVAPCG